MNYDPKQYWEERGKNYTVSADTSMELKNLAGLISEYARAGDFFLEIGSGYGRIFQFLMDNDFLANKSYSMCDISQSMIYNCYINTGIMPGLWDGKILPYEDNCFDWTISFSVMLHVPPADIFNHFKENIRVCKKYLYIATYYGPKRGLAKHNFRHSYDLMIEELDLKIIDKKIFMDGLRVNWLLEKKIEGDADYARI